MCYFNQHKAGMNIQKPWLLLEKMRLVMWPMGLLLEFTRGSIELIKLRKAHFWSKSHFYSIYSVQKKWDSLLLYIFFTEKWDLGEKWACQSFMTIDLINSCLSSFHLSVNLFTLLGFYPFKNHYNKIYKLTSEI